MRVVRRLWPLKPSGGSNLVRLLGKTIGTHNYVGVGLKRQRYLVSRAKFRTAPREISTTNQLFGAG